MSNRRSFLKLSAAIGGALGLESLPRLALGESLPRPWTPRPAPAAESLSILIIGGTGFTGPEQVEHALARGHRVTVINRNKTRPDFFRGKSQVEQLIGDLSGDMSALKGRSFDAVLDIPTTYPYWVRNVAQYMKGHTKHYTFISTQSVYSDDSIVNADESLVTTPMPPDLDPYTLEPTARGKYYGALKTFSENLVKETYPNALIIRPGLIVGPLDPSDRFTYWPARIDKGGEVLAPDKPDDPCQFIDSRDLAEWMIRMAEAKELGLYNAIGPEKPLTIAEMLYGVKAITTAGAQFTWVPWEFLQEQNVRPWRHMTVWQPPYGRTAGYQRRNASKAIAKGLTFRPLAVTAKDTLDWHKTRPEKDQLATLDGEINGLSMTREAEVLAAWKAKKAAE
jgi:2'-hydroxyisoflavone reductase